LVLAIELQNRVSSTIQLLKPFTIGHRAVLMSGFNFFYLQFSPQILKWLLLFAHTSDLGDYCSHAFITVSFIFKNVLYTILSQFGIYYKVVV
jgi:hypothetical protein